MKQHSVRRDASNSPAGLSLFLMILGILVALGGTVFAFADFAWNEESSVIACGLILIAAWVSGSLLWALAWLLRQQYETSLYLKRVMTLLGERSQPAADQPLTAGSGVRAESGNEMALILAQLRELNATMLLSDEQLRTKRVRRQQLLAGQLGADALAAISQGNLQQAQEILERLGNEVPGDLEADKLREALVRAKSSADAEELLESIRRCEDFIAVGDYKKATVAAEEVLAKYPSAPEAIALFDRVGRESETFASQQRRVYYEEVQKFSDSRQWRRALDAADRLIEDYPDSPEANAIGGQMSTLRSNAQLEEVRRLRDDISKLIERKRYSEAVKIAEDIIVRFPGTQAAIQLSEQIIKLRELAQGA